MVKVRQMVKGRQMLMACKVVKGRQMVKGYHRW